MSDELGDVIREASKVPVVPKKMPQLKEPKRITSEIKEQALAILKDIDLTAKTTQNRHKGVIKRIVEPEAVYEAFRYFEEALGGRKALIETLQHCPENSVGYGVMHKLLADPDFLNYAVSKGNKENVGHSLSVLCTRHRIPLNALVSAFRDSKMAKVAVEALIQVSESTPKVVQQLVEDSQNRYDPCELCEGSGRLWRIGEDGEWLLDKDGGHVTQLCHSCRGMGKKFMKHDVQNRKMFLEMAGLSQKTPLVQQTFNQAAFVPGDGSFERILRSLDNVVVVENEVKSEVPNTYYEAEVIDAEKGSDIPDNDS